MDQVPKENVDTATEKKTPPKLTREQDMQNMLHFIEQGFAEIAKARGVPRAAEAFCIYLGGLCSEQPSPAKAVRRMQHVMHTAMTTRVRAKLMGLT